LKALETRRSPELRYRWKLELVKGLYKRGYTAEDVRQLFCLYHLKNWGQQKNAGQKNSAQPARPDFSAPHFSAQARSG
jgi:hypothetical protein